MRNLVFIAFLLGLLAAFDAVAFDGYYRTAAWENVKYQADQFNQQIHNWLGTMGL